MPNSNNLSSSTKKTKLDWFYFLANLFVGSLLLILGVLNVLSGANSGGASSGVRAFIVGIYGCLFGLTILLAEFGANLVVFKYVGFLANLFGRGMFYLYAGVLMFVPFEVNAALFIISIVVMVIGVSYSIFWLFPSMRRSNNTA